MIIEIMDWILLGLLQQKSEIIKGIFLYLIGRYWYIICYIPLIGDCFKFCVNTKN